MNSQPLTVGEELRRTRQQAGFDLPDVAAQLRIRSNFLSALEDGRPDALPGITYAIGYVRTYAGFLGLDPEIAVRRFKEEAAGLNSKTQLVFPSPAPEGRVPGLTLMLVAAILAGGAFGGWYWLSERDGDLRGLVPAVPERLAQLIEGDAPAVAAGPAVSAPPAAEPAGMTASYADANPAGMPVPTAKPAASAAASVAAAPSGAPTAAPATGAPPGSALPASAPSAGAPSAGAPMAGSPAASAPSAAPVPTPASPAAKPAAGAQVAAAPARNLEQSLPEGSPVRAPTPATPALAPLAATTAAAPAAATADADSDGTPDETSPPEPTAGGQGIPSAPPIAQPAHAGQDVPAAPRIAALIGASEAAVPAGRTLAGPVDRVMIRATGDSWVQVRDAQGTALFTRVLREGDVYRVPEQPGLRLATGNAGALQILVDGAPAPSLGGFGEVVRNVLLDPTRLAAGTAAGGGR